ncbi:hypothetical protein FA13DRAFT_1729500 [Coprinellus micaceus]|uniref:HAD-like protein n=1 Tax=Coprinellus micaceus TaxID=71717 RepID=A0A4Y7TJ82_COPMI|nr:hypothetical protein FA13DRAFT_1729500 [Coprinellus micaceus]
MAATVDSVPESTLPYPSIHTDKRTELSRRLTSNDTLTDNLGYGYEKRRQGNFEILADRLTFRDGFRDMLKSVSDNGHTIEECKKYLKEHMRLDPGFKEFYQFCKDNDIPFIIVSSGMAPLIRAVLSTLIGEQDASEIEIIANEVDIFDDGKWDIHYRHPSSGFGHDKSQAILPYRRLPEPPVIFFFGDGVSDISAARHADVLFAKEKPNGENDLSVYCTKHGIKHLHFQDFSDATPVVSSIVKGDSTVEQIVG